MTTHFQHLSEQEKQILFDAIPLITILVAGADADIEETEMHWAEKLAHIRTYDDKSEPVQDYYEQIDGMVDDRVRSYLTMFSKEHPKRMEEVSAELEKLNPILAKLDSYYSARLYRSFLSFAKHVAQSSGGFIRYFTIGPKEDKVIDLPMIHPIEL